MEKKNLHKNLHIFFLKSHQGARNGGHGRAATERRGLLPEAAAGGAQRGHVPAAADCKPEAASGVFLIFLFYALDRIENQILRIT